MKELETEHIAADAKKPFAMSPSWFVRTTLAAIGYGFTAVLLIQGFQSGRFPFPGGDVVDFYARAGDALRSGETVYFPGFLYGPPWAVAFASVSWLGAGAIHAVVLILDVVALLVIANRNPHRLGYLLWFPLIAFELAAGQLNLLIAAALVAAQRGVTWPLAAMTLAKVWPAIGLPPRQWRAFLRTAIILSLMTLPWLSLWPEWIAALIRTSASPLGPVIPIPWAVRAVAAAGLLLLRRPWATALAASIASPGLYWGQLVVLVAPVALFFEARSASRRRPAMPDSRPGPLRQE